MDGPAVFAGLDAATCRRLAVELFNHVWTFIGRDDRDEEDDAEMVAAAHASLLFWRQVGQPVHFARGEWQVARAYATAGRPDPAVHHASRCLAICQEHGLGPFDEAAAHEELARAHAIAGDAVRSRHHEARAHEIAAAITDPEDLAVLMRDLEALPTVG